MSSAWPGSTSVSVCIEGTPDSYSQQRSADFQSLSGKGPPDQKRYSLCIYPDESHCNKGGDPALEVDLLKACGGEMKRFPAELSIIAEKAVNRALVCQAGLRQSKCYSGALAHSRDVTMSQNIFDLLLVGCPSSSPTLKSHKSPALA